MASPAQMAANRANAQKSTGPRTVEGKKRSSMSALKHGLAAKTLVLASLYSQYEPATPQECMLVDQLASAWWRTLRVRQIETDMLDLQIRTLNNKYPEKEKTKTTDRQALAVRFVTESEKDFVNFMRYDAQIERAFYRALNTLEKLQAKRVAQACSLGLPRLAAWVQRQNRDRQGADKPPQPQQFTTKLASFRNMRTTSRTRWNRIQKYRTLSPIPPLGKAA